MASFTELWTGTNGAAWPAGWTTTAGGGTATIQGNAGQISTAASASVVTRSSHVGVANGDLLVDFTLASTAEQYVDILARSTSTTAFDAGYSVSLDVLAATVSISEWAAGNDTALTSASFTFAAATLYTMRYQFTGSTLRARIWAAGSAEPGTWLVTTTDTTVTAAGSIHLVVSSGAAATARTVTFDNLIVDDLDVNHVVGTAAVNLGGLTASAAGVRSTAGTAAAALGDLTVSASGTVVPLTNASAPLGGLTVTAAGLVAHPATAAVPLGGLTVAGTGTIIGAPTAAAPLGGLTVAATGLHTATASAAAPLGGLTAAAAAVRSQFATATALLGGLTVTGTAFTVIGEPPVLAALSPTVDVRTTIRPDLIITVDRDEFFHLGRYNILYGDWRRLYVNFYLFAGGPPQDVTGLTIAIATAGGVVVLAPTPVGIEHLDVGSYMYPWGTFTTPGDGTYVVTWAATTGDGDPITATETVTIADGLPSSGFGSGGYGAIGYGA